MIVAIAASIDQEIDRLLHSIAQIHTLLKERFADKTYGDGVESIFIGLILTGPGSDRLHPVRGLKYRKKFTLKSALTRNTEYLGNAVEFDIKPDYETIRTMNSERAAIYIADSLIRGLGILEKNHAKFPNFDLVRFTTDFSSCLRELAV